MGSRNADWRKQLIDMVGPHGWELIRERKHLIFRGPDGRQVVVANTVSDSRRAFLNARSVFRRNGCDC